MAIDFKRTRSISVMFGVACAAITVPANGQDQAQNPANERTIPSTETEAREAIQIGRTYANYPSQALREGLQGQVGYSFTVSKEGRVVDCVVTESSGHAVLDEAACKNIVRRSRFKPALDANGNPISQSLSRVANFRLEPSSSE
ncbi:MAG: energy transducer TonB [Pseudomonadota bacterium]